MRIKVLLSVINLISLSACDKQLYTLSKSELEQLVFKNDLQQLKNVLKYEGGFSVTNLSADYKLAVEDLKSSAAECLNSYRYPDFNLPDGSIRTTWASESSEYPPCLSRTSSIISSEFDKVYSRVSAIFKHVAGNDSLTWRPSEEGEVKDFSELPKKEHIHVYHGKESEGVGGNYAAPFHTDNGILLLITPFQEHPLQVKTVGGQLLDTSHLDSGSVIILNARGLSEWLLRGTPESRQFVPAPHAVQTLATGVDLRTVYARMMVAPLDAVPANPAAKKVKFEEVFFNHPESGHQGEMCTLDEINGGERARVPRSHAAVHDSDSAGFESLKKEECTGNTSYCWMGCLDLATCPQHDINVCTNSVGANCCTDPKDEGTGNCADMDPTCQWKCAVDPTPDPPTDNFCNPKLTPIDMYMNGFETSGQHNKNCVLLFFKTWVLDTRVKFFFGCIGVIILGVIVEGLLCLRRLIQSKKILRIMSNPLRRGSIIVLFGMNIALGYLAMLVAMTYSVELFLCMVIGLVLGHAVFNTAAPVGESVDPCCASQVIGTSHDSGSESSNMTNES